MIGVLWPDGGVVEVWFRCGRGVVEVWWHC